MRPIRVRLQDHGPELIGARKPQITEDDRWITPEAVAALRTKAEAAGFDAQRIEDALPRLGEVTDHGGIERMPGQSRGGESALVVDQGLRLPVGVGRRATCAARKPEAGNDSGWFQMGSGGVGFLPIAYPIPERSAPLSSSRRMRAV